MKALFGILIAALAAAGGDGPARTYPIVGTGQTRCYSDAREIRPPGPGQPFYGQDAQHPGPAPAYRDNGDGTVSDLNTGLMWVQARGSKVTRAAAAAGASACRVGGHGGHLRVGPRPSAVRAG